MHPLRHFYASVLLDGGESIRMLAEYLGHACGVERSRTFDVGEQNGDRPLGQLTAHTQPAPRIASAARG
jgi:integrase